mgnify:CR=1 FL=1|jgi:hypothetical protein
MKKLLLLLLCVPLIGLGQGLGDYYISEGNPKTNGLEFKIKKPIGYELSPVFIPTTIVEFKKSNNGVLTQFNISIYTFEQLGFQDMKNASKSELKDIIVQISQYYELCDYPGFIDEDGDQGYRQLTSFTFIGNNVFTIRVIVKNTYIPSDVEDLFYKMSKTLEFIGE